MTERDSAADLDFWSGRARGGSVGQDPEPPARPYRSSRAAWIVARFPTLRRISRPSLPRWRRRAALSWKSTSTHPNSPRGKAGPVAAAALLAGLTGAWLLVGSHAHGSPSVAARTITTDSSTPATTVAPPPSPSTTTTTA